MPRIQVKVYIEEEIHRAVKRMVEKMPAELKVELGIKNISDFYEKAIIYFIEAVKGENGER